MGAALHWLTGIPPPPLAPLLHVLLSINAILLAWRLVIRGSFTALAYGRREALWALPRTFVGNLIAMLAVRRAIIRRSEEHTSELQSLMRISYAVFCLKKKTKHERKTT